MDTEGEGMLNQAINRNSKRRGQVALPYTMFGFHVLTWLQRCLHRLFTYTAGLFFLLLIDLRPLASHFTIPSHLPAMSHQLLWTHSISNCFACSTCLCGIWFLSWNTNNIDALSDEALLKTNYLNFQLHWKSIMPILLVNHTYLDRSFLKSQTDLKPTKTEHTWCNNHYHYKNQQYL